MTNTLEDDWEYQEIVPLAFRNSEQLRILEERRLIEEADNSITEDLFSPHDNITKNLTNNLTQNFIQKEKTKQNNKINKAVIEINQKLEEKIHLKTNRQFENEQKQKEISNILKKQKEDKKRLAEIYGEADNNDNKYEFYEDMYSR
jgi:hypothetical protein